MRISDWSSDVCSSDLVAEAARSQGIDRLMHTGTLDLPDPSGAAGLRHYLYCDHTWDLAVRHRPEARYRQSREVAGYEEMEARAYACTRHIFPFGRYVPDNLTQHYGVPAQRVPAVAQGMGRIQPSDQPQRHPHDPFLFSPPTHLPTKAAT